MISTACNGIVMILPFPRHLTEFTLCLQTCGLPIHIELITLLTDLSAGSFRDTTGNIKALTRALSSITKLTLGPR